MKISESCVCSDRQLSTFWIKRHSSFVVLWLVTRVLYSTQTPLFMNKKTSSRSFVKSTLNIVSVNWRPIFWQLHSVSQLLGNLLSCRIFLMFCNYVCVCLCEFLFIFIYIYIYYGGGVFLGFFHLNCLHVLFMGLQMYILVRKIKISMFNSFYLRYSYL